IDTAGWHEPASAIDAEGQRLGESQAASCDLALWCAEAGRLPSETPPNVASIADGVSMLRVHTKCDLAAAPTGELGTSTVNGAGLNELRRRVVECARAGVRSQAAPHLSRCRHLFGALLGHLCEAHHVVLEGDPLEVVALELRAAIDLLGEMVGAVYTDDLLDR